MLVVSDPGRSALEQAEQRALARPQWLAAKILTVQLEQVGAKQNDLRLGLGAS
jgi:hypothetical protein